MDVVEEDDDEVVRELEVYVTEQSELDLYLLQFPLRACYAHPPDVLDARIKQQHEIMELSVSHEALRENAAPMRMMSTKVAQEQQGRLCVGLVRDEALHITQLNEVLQMRPSFKHLAAPRQSSQQKKLRRAEQQQQQHSADSNNSMSEDDGSDAAGSGGSVGSSSGRSRKDKPALQKVVLHKMESERMQSVRLQSYTYVKSLQDAEVFQKLNAHAIDSAVSEQQFQRCYSNKKKA